MTTAADPQRQSGSTRATADPFNADFADELPASIARISGADMLCTAEACYVP